MNIDQHLKSLNCYRCFFSILEKVIGCLNAILLAGSFLGVWIVLRPQQLAEQLAIFIVVLVLGLLMTIFKSSQEIIKENFLLAMEMQHPQVPESLLAESNKKGKLSANWQKALKKEKVLFLKFKMKRLGKVMATLPIPFCLFLFAYSAAPQVFSTAYHNITHAVSHLNHGAYMKIIEGSVKPNMGLVELNGSGSKTIELLSQNMVELSVVGAPGDSLYQVQLKKLSSAQDKEKGEQKVFQTFQLFKVDGASQSGGTYRISFSITENMEIYLPHLSGENPVLTINVKKVPLPKVSLAAAIPLKDPWPDDKPIPLKIHVEGKNPLKQVKLIIKTGGRSFQELVNNVYTDNLKEISNSHSLILESYLQSDEAQVEVIAEATDRAVPTSLTGKSEPLLINTISAYARYRQTLQTLREIKSFLDDSENQAIGKVDLSVKQLMSKAIQQAEESPFFDSLDRVTLSHFDEKLGQVLEKKNLDTLSNLNRAISDFLYEHETLDDKERDRDFFVAARSLSRLMEKARAERPVSISIVTRRMIAFLDDRFKRWQIRVGRLKKTPSMWRQIKGRPFTKNLNRISKLEKNKSGRAARLSFETLSQTVATYRQWLENLEQNEESARKQREQARQEGLASARNTLKELQKRQSRISSQLDRAETRKKAIADSWPSVRMEQSSNIQKTAELEAQLRSIAPRAGERIRAAADAMKYANKTGNRGAFVEAESSSDFAGRLLRQAQSAAQRAQRQQRRRGKRRRITGDNYHGSQVAGGDVEIKRGYEVNRRYREDILDDVRRHARTHESDEEQNSLLENYLRQVIR